MFKLLRRISYGVIARPDRPWEDDATSNAPAPSKKRRLSSVERNQGDEDEDESLRKKRLRKEGGSDTPDGCEQTARETPLPQGEDEPKEVKEVTEGVKEVDLGSDSKVEVLESEEAEAEEQTMEDGMVAPESVPLPDEDANGELDDELDELENSEYKELGGDKQTIISETVDAVKESVQEDEKSEKEDGEVAVVDTATNTALPESPKPEVL